MDTALKTAGFLLLADISGWQKYINEVELEHAAEATRNLLNTLQEELAPPMHIAGIQGDAVLAYLDDREVGRPGRVLDLCHHSYGIFKDLLANMTRNTTCNCQACMDLHNLDLNLLLHHGQYIATPIHDQIEINGLAAMLIRGRVFKDQLQGKRAVALLTREAIDQIGLTTEGLTITRESYEDFGEVQAAHIDLRQAYQAMRHSREFFVTPEESHQASQVDLDTTPAEAWEWINQPRLRNQWANTKSRRWEAILRPGGRMAKGAINHCYHGVGKTTETVVDWRPYDYFSTRINIYGIHAIQTWVFKTLEGGQTHLQIATQFIGPGKWLPLRLLLKASLQPVLDADLVRLARLIRHKPSG